MLQTLRSHKALVALVVIVLALVAWGLHGGLDPSGPVLALGAVAMGSSRRPSVLDVVKLPKLVLPKKGADPRDPFCVGYDRQTYNGLAGITQVSETLDFAASGSDSVPLPRDRLITALTLVADPAQFDGDGANTPTIVQDAQDKLIQSLSVVGGPTYVSINGGATAYLKALGNLNKLVYPGMRRADLPTGTGADQQVRFGWHMNFGALNDFDPFDITAGIPAEMENTLKAEVTFAANNIVAATAAHLTIDTATDIYAVVWGVQGLPKSYLGRLPIPEIVMDSKTSPTTTTTFNIKTGRFLKRTTVLNLAAAASNNAARNDSNLTDISLIFTKPTRSPLLDRVRWHVARSMFSHWERGVVNDEDGASAVAPDKLVGVLTIDWRRLTKNPYGLNLLPFSSEDVQLEFTVGTTTGSIWLLHEYYVLPDPSVAEGWPPYRPQ